MDSSLCPWHAEHKTRIMSLEANCHAQQAALAAHCNGSHIRPKDFEKLEKRQQEDADAMTESVHKLADRMDAHERAADVERAGLTRMDKLIGGGLIVITPLLVKILEYVLATH